MQHIPCDWVLRAEAVQTYYTKKKKAVCFIGSLAIWYSLLCPLSNPTALTFSVSLAICMCQQLANETGMCRSIVTGIVLFIFYLLDSSPF